MQMVMTSMSTNYALSSASINNGKLVCSRPRVTSWEPLRHTRCTLHANTQCDWEVYQICTLQEHVVRVRDKTTHISSTVRSTETQYILRNSRPLSIGITAMFCIVIVIITNYYKYNYSGVFVQIDIHIRSIRRVNVL